MLGLVLFLTSYITRWSTVEKIDEKFDLFVSGCDVKIVPGKKSSLRLTRYVWDLATLARGSRFLAVNNLAGCRNAPYFRCQHICYAKIFLKEASSSLLRITESSGHSSHRMRLRVSPGVALHEFVVKGNFDVDLTNVRISGGLSISTTTGNVKIVGSAFSCGVGESKISSKRGSIYVVETAAGSLLETSSHSLNLMYRTTTAKACFTSSSNAQGNLIFNSKADDFEVCDLNGAVQYYDADSNGFVTQNEFERGLAHLDVCVGGQCPHESSPLTRTQLIFNSGDVLALTQITNNEFAARLAQNNFTEYVPSCYRSAILSRHDSTLPPNRSLILDVQSGEIRVDLGSPYSGSWYDPIVPFESNQMYWQGIETLSGIRMLQADADILAEKLRRFTSPSRPTNRFVFAVIDVEVGIGVPADRWIYTSNDVYLQLNPALLEIFSYGSLAPKIARYRIRFTNGDACGQLGGFDTNSSYYMSRARERVYREIRAALTDQPALKGELVRVKINNRFFPYASNLEAYRQTDDDEYEAFDYERNAPGTARNAFFASFVFALLTGLYVLVRFMQAMIAVRHHADTIKALQRRLLTRYKQKSGSTRTIALEHESDYLDSATLQDSERSTYFSLSLKSLGKHETVLRLIAPFLHPISTIDSVVIVPARRLIVDPMSIFIQMRCSLHNPKKYDDIACFVNLDLFMQAHRAFCFNKKLQPISGRDNLFEALSKFDLRLQKKRFPYLVGARWKVAKYGTLRNDERALVDCSEQFVEAESFFEQVNYPQNRSLAAFLEECTERASKEVTIPIFDSCVFSFDGAFSVKTGLSTAFQDYSSCSLKNLDDLGERIKWKTQLVVMGLRMRNSSGGGKQPPTALPTAAHFRAACIVWFHTLFLLLWPCFLLICSHLLQIKYGKFAANVVANGSEYWFSSYDYGRVSFAKYVRRLTGFVFVSKYFGYTSIAYVAATLLRQYTHYAGEGTHWIPAMPLLLRSVISAVCAAASLLTILNCVVYAIMTLLWLLAGAVIDPNEYLRYASAAATIIGVAASLQSELRSAAASFKVGYEASLRAKLIGLSRHAMETEKSSFAHGDERFTNLEREDIQDETSIAFRLIDRQNNGTISFEEIASFVRSLRMEVLDDEKVEQIFAYADKNVDEQLDEDEFEAAWTFLKQEIISDALQKAGLGPSSIATTLALALFLMFGTFAFIFWVVAAFTQAHTFAAIVEAGVVAIAGIAIKGVAKKQKSTEEMGSK